MTVHTRRMGTPGGLPTLLAHCFLGHGGTWAPLVAALKTPIDALAFDMPGHGRSPMPDPPGDLHKTVSGLIGELAPQPSLVIGHSFGGASALRHAVERPEQVRGLVLIEPVFFAAARHTAEWQDYARQHGAINEALAAGQNEPAARMFYAFNDSSRDWDALPQPARDQMAAQIALLPATEPGVVHDTGGLLAPGRLEALDCPVLLLAGKRSPPMFRAVVAALAAILPRARVELVQGAGHMLPMTHAGEAAARIDGWLLEQGLAPGNDSETAKQKPRVG